MERVTINGVELAHEAVGSGDDTILLVHGGIVADAFRPLVAESGLTNRYRLIHYHRRGYGGSARAAGAVSVEDHAADCRALLAHLGVERAHVVGYSYGGSITLQLALDVPHLVQTLALLEPVVPAAMMNPATTEFFMQAVGAAMELYGAGQKAAAVDTFCRAAFGPEYRATLERVLPGATDRAVVDCDAVFQSEFPSLYQWRFTDDEAARITQPVLSVYHHDPAWRGFEETHQQLRNWLPQAEAYAAPVSSHLLPMVAPQPLGEALIAFFGRHSLGATA